VCAYDRAGLGWSEAATVSTTLARVLDDVGTVMAKALHTRPYVMVGHSFGAFVCLAYAAQHPEQVAGLVLVDPPTDWMRMTPRQATLLRGARQMSRLGGML